jgi:hypothetical protein
LIERMHAQIATIEQFADTCRVKRLPAGRPSKKCGNKTIEISEDVIEGKIGFIGAGWGEGGCRAQHPQHSRHGAQ